MPALKARPGRLGRTLAVPVVAAALTAPLLSCAEPRQALLGTWVSVGSEAAATTYVFHEDGRAEWILKLSEASDTFEVPYRANYGTTPIQLDVGPWDSGPLAGQTLFGIVEVQGPDRFRVDFEPADPDGDGSERPVTFSEQAVTFVRKIPTRQLTDPGAGSSPMPPPTPD